MVALLLKGIQHPIHFIRVGHIVENEVAFTGNGEAPDFICVAGSPLIFGFLSRDLFQSLHKRLPFG